MKRKSQSRSVRARGRRGFILLTTLLIIAMVGLLTVGLARHSINQAVAAKLSQKELQQKWGAASCQRYALQQRQGLLTEKVWDDESQAWLPEPLLTSTNTIQLGDSQFVVTIEDESGKFNINRSLQSRSRQATTSTIRRLSGINSGFTVQLRVLREGRGPMEDAVESWAQVFQMDSSFHTPGKLKIATEEITCWGSQLNYMTASDEVFVETVKPLIGGVLTQKLKRILGSEKGEQWAEELKAAGANANQIASLKPLLVPRSYTQAIWVESAESNRTWLTVSERVSTSINRIHSFSW